MARPDNHFKSGFITVIGCPNVGKSTLMNAMLGQKISIVSDKPQTTRNKITGIKNLEGAQLIFIDTPGLHKGKYLLNDLMMKDAGEGLKGADIVLAVIDAQKPFADNDTFLRDILKDVGIPVILVINKIDLIRKERLLSIISRLSTEYNFTEILPLSALKQDGINRLIKVISGHLPDGERYFPEEIITDRPERFVVGEIIREKVFNRTSEEIPHSVAVLVTEFKEKNELISISAEIYVEKDSQKGIIIGKAGSLLKNIGTQARHDIEELLGCKVYLELRVKVKRAWRKDSRFLKELGIGN